MSCALSVDMVPKGPFAPFPVLATERLVLGPLQIEDGPANFSFKFDVEVVRRYGQEPHRSVEETRAWLEKRIDEFARRVSIMWAITLKGDSSVCGEMCRFNFDASFRTAEVGYELHRSPWGKGFAAEGLSALPGFGFDGMNLHRIEACSLAGNEPSSRLRVKLGFLLEGRLRQHHSYRGHFEDPLYFGLLRDEWRNRSRTL